MQIRPFTTNDSSAVVKLWNEEATKYDYKPLTEHTFYETFIDHSYFDARCIWVGCEGDDIVGFAAGCSGNDLPLGDVAGYITTVIVRSTIAEAKHYDGMLQHMEERFNNLGKKQVELLFFNPMKIAWVIPSNPHHEHNNAPGISKDFPLYAALLARGYMDRATQCGMYLPLGNFVIPDDMIEKERKANNNGYHIARFDATVHTGLNELLVKLGNLQWEQDIDQYTKQGVPVLMAIQGTTCVGFAGPIIRQSNGRAFFCGIGVHPNHEGHGLGSVLFYRMVEAFQHAECHYISLFTGSNNPAIRIYKKAGFTIEKEFSILRRELAYE